MAQADSNDEKNEKISLDCPFKTKIGAYHSEGGEGAPAGLELAGSAHSVTLALHLHVLLHQLNKKKKDN